MKFLILFLVTSCALFAQIVEGTVANSVSGAPIAGAAVKIETAGHTVYQATSDAQGAFHMEGVANGRYLPSVVKPGFQIVPESVVPFQMQTGADVNSLKFSLTPLGKLSGTVLDGNDRPVPGANVWLLQGTAVGQGLIADAKGGFLLENITPGSYFLSARSPTGFAPPAPVGDEHYGWAHTWFPGVADINAAQKIVIRPGAELVDQDVKLHAVPVHSLRGKIHDGNGDPAPKLPISLLSGGPQPVELHTVSSADGSFRFADLPDGFWNLSAELASGDITLRALAGVTMAGRENEGLEFRLAAPFSVPLDLVIATAEATTKPPGAVMLVPDWGGRLVPVSSRDKDGNYKIEGVYPGRYKITPFPPPGPYYLDSISLGDSDITGQAVEFSSGSVPLKIVYKSDGGAIRGTVEDCGNAAIVLAPVDPAFERPEYSLVPTARCTADGHFEFRNLRPGQYYAFAFDHFNQLATEFLSGLPAVINKAVTVEVKSKETATVDLKVTPQ